MKRLMLACFVTLAAIASLEISAPNAAAVDCSLVRCMECPAGYRWAPTGNNCCRCLPD